MEITLYQDKDRLLIQLGGRVVLDECDRLKATVMPRIAPGVAKVMLDLSSVEFIDSAGLGALVGMKVTSNKNRASLSLLSPSKGVQDILVVSKLDAIFEIVTGGDADGLVGELARPDHKVSLNNDQTQPLPPAPQSFQAPPASPATTAAPSGSNAGRIEQLCKDAVEFMRARDYEAAVDCYTKVLELDPEYMPAMNNLAIVYEKKPHWQDKAVAQWEKVMALSQSRGDQKHIERAQKHLAHLQNL